MGKANYQTANQRLVRLCISCRALRFLSRMIAGSGYVIVKNEEIFYRKSRKNI